MNTKTITAAIVALTMLVMAASPLLNDTNELQPITIVEFGHGGGVTNGTAIFGGILTWQDDAWNATWNCSGGLALVTPSDWSNFVASGDNDPHNYTSWGIGLTGAGSYYTENAPEGEWVVTAGLGCTDDAGEPRSAGGQFGDVHDNPPTVNLTNGTTVGDVSFTLIEHGGGGDSMETIEIETIHDNDDGGATASYNWQVDLLAPEANYTVTWAVYYGDNESMPLDPVDLVGSDGEWQYRNGDINMSSLPADGCYALAVQLVDADNGHFFDADFEQFEMGDGCDGGIPTPEELVDMFDSDGDGKLSLNELIDGIKEMMAAEGEGEELSEEEEDMIEDGFNESDADGDGLLDLDELGYFIDMMEDENGGDGPTFVCGDGEEIPFDYVNDGDEDCDDGSDEPQDFDGDGVTDNWFDCHDGSNISMDMVNDGSDDCPDGEDEGNYDDYEEDWTFGEAILNATTTVMSPLYDPTVACDGGVGLMTADDFSLWDVLNEDPVEYLTWGTDHGTAGNVVDYTAPEGVYVVLAVLECGDNEAVFAGYDMSATGEPVMHTFVNGTTTTVAINLFYMEDDDGGDDGPNCEPNMVISFQQMGDHFAELTFTNTCTFDATGSEQMITWMDSDGDGTLSTAEIAAAQDEMANKTCHDENGTEVPCGDDDDEGLFSFDGTVMVTQPMMDDVAMTISVEAGLLTMSSTEVIMVPSNDDLTSHTFEYAAGADWDGGNEECMGGLDITAASPWSVSNVSISPSTDWVSAIYADGSGWHIENTDADGDGDCNSEPSSVVIVFTTPEPEPEPVIDTTPVCDIYYNVGGAVLTAGSAWSVQVQGAVSFEVPSNGEFTLALPVGEYSVILACEDAEGDAIVVSVTDGTDTWGGTAQDGVIYAEGLFNITEDNVSESVDLTLTWSSTDFGGTFSTNFTAVESLADAIEETSTGGLPGFTSVITITAMLGAAMILSRRKD